jgi:serine/threonine protein kinase
MTDFARIGYKKLKHGAEVYEFVEWLGKGAFGEVFRARRVSDGCEVAVKRLFSPGQSARFVREAKILQGAAHPNLTEYIDFVEVHLRVDEREYYLILEYLEGMPGASLRERIDNSESGLDATEALRLFMGYLDCLEHLHRKGIIHRDIKPGNLYAPAGNPCKGKIFDLGIAHDEEGTRTHGQVPGTMDYMPPEFAIQNSGRGSPQSDIYSMGVTLYLSLTRERI